MESVLSEPRVMVFTNQVLPISQTFVADHCKYLRRYRPTLVGLTEDPSISGFDFPSVVLAPSRLKNTLFNLGLFSRMRRLISEIRPSIIHAHFADNASLMLPYALAANVPLVVTLHGYDVTLRFQPSNALTRIVKSRRKRLATRSSLVLAVSNYIRERAIEEGFVTSNLKVHYLGIPITSNDHLFAGSKPPRIAFAGRLVEKKGIDNVVAAFAEVRRQIPSAELHVVGDGPLRPLVENAKAQIGGIVCYGAVPNSRLLDIVRSSRLFTMPSRVAQNGDAEGLGLVLLEAQALGVPAVTSNVTGTTEAVVDGVTGLCVDPSDTSALARAYVALLSDVDRCDEMGRAGAKWVRENFDIVARTNLLETMYDQVLQSRSLAA
jgi:glycosyltransferase involved in cell wall biosynthesis